MWHHLLPADFFDEDTSTLFIGIGSVIQHNYPRDALKLVVGSGFGGYTRLPDMSDKMWDFRFVRGPRTAEALGLDPQLAITDAAVLLRATPLPVADDNIGVAFIPHYESIERGNWREACKLAGIHFIDPTEPTDRVISQLRGANLVITEAMHGAIVSDAVRTPWIGVKTMHHVHRFKWFDWVESLSIPYDPKPLFPSNGREAWAVSTGRSGSGPRAQALFNGPVGFPVNRICTHFAARSLEKLARMEPSLSSDTEIERATDRALGAVDLMLRDYGMRLRKA
ncbi:polysaccharide pyruvyl transferase family protein (plasmid) [Qingshengfaniella alkalisoli]|uniref:Polysaccharide pyruvyl transferase family protein n=2 Tax=Qingshengfaniella alkalisoli TaxID=2599296 RepID=A0A5B8IDH5_9RHOB|nr:polysaccharide pyruvyl transferase family protein [Qingshengfaniella alkalisoli]